MTTIRYHKATGRIVAHGLPGYISGQVGCALMTIDELPYDFTPAKYRVDIQVTPPVLMVRDDWTPPQE